MIQTEFGISVKKRMLDLRISSFDLCNMVKENTNKYFDQPYLSKILSGKSKNKIFKEAIINVLKMENEN